METRRRESHPVRQADQEVSHIPGRKRRERTLKALGS